MARKTTSLADLGGIVYSTDRGRLCPGCGEAADQCRCSEQQAPSGDGVVRVRRETKGRSGKTVTVVMGLPLQGEALKTLTAALKKRCGTGGSVKDGQVEIQGDHLALLLAELQQRGYKAIQAGG